MTKGLDAHVSLVEVYETDIVNPMMQCVLASTQNQLTGAKVPCVSGEPPTTLSTTTPTRTTPNCAR